MTLMKWTKAIGLAGTIAVLAAPVASALEIKVGSYEPESHYLVEYVYKPYLEEIEKRTKRTLPWWPEAAVRSFKRPTFAYRDAASAGPNDLSVG